jgi:hypothetical protein
MNIGYIGKSSTGEIVVLEEFKENNKLVYYEEIPLHPYHKTQLFELGSEVNFQYAKECTIHYPEFCSCYKQTTFAVIIPDKKKKSFFKKIKSLWK